MSRTNLRILAALGGALSLLAATASAQVASRIRGGVRDASDAVVNGARVTVEDINRGTSQTTQTNEAGQFSFPNLIVGDYRVSAEFAGFKKATVADFKLDVNQTVEVNLRLEVGQVSEVVEVEGAAAPLLQTTDSQVGNLIENKRIVEMPLAARDFMQLALLSPGVSESTGNRRHQTERALDRLLQRARPQSNL